MSVSIWVRGRGFQIGTASFLKSLFSTIYLRLESGAWGSRFPHLMNELYAGQLPAASAEETLMEITKLRTELSRLPVTSVVWDFEDPRLGPPWGTKISAAITNLGNYWVTADGRDLLAVLAEAVEEAQRTSSSATLS